MAQITISESTAGTYQCGYRCSSNLGCIDRWAGIWRAPKSCSHIRVCDVPPVPYSKGSRVYSGPGDHFLAVIISVILLNLSVARWLLWSSLSIRQLPERYRRARRR